MLDSPVFIEESDLDLLQRRLLEKEARRMVMVILPEAGGPPVTLGVGHLLPGGEVSLDPGMEVSGIFWENMDRHGCIFFIILRGNSWHYKNLGARISWKNIQYTHVDRIIHTNGTIVYKVTGSVEEGEVIFGTLGRAGTVSVLPQHGNVALDLETLRFLNINKPLRVAGK